MKHPRKRIVPALLTLLVCISILPLGIVFGLAADMDGQRVSYTAGPPTIHYDLSYTKSRPNNSQMTYTFTVKTSLGYSDSWMGTGYVFTGTFTANGVSGSVTIRSYNDSWSGVGPHSTKSVSITVPSTSGSASQNANFKVTVDNHNGGSYGAVSKDFTVTSSPLYTLTLNANGGSASPTSATQSPFTLPTPTRTGHTCKGWYTDSSGGTKVGNPGDSYTITANKTIYAQWTANTLSVSYHANSGALTSDTYKLSSSLVYKISDNTKYVQTWTYNDAKENGLTNASTFGLARTGHSFSGWGTSSSGGTIFDQNDTALTPLKINADLATQSCSSTLYATWTANTLSVSFHANGGSVTSDTYKLSSNLIYLTSDNTKYIQTWTYNNAKTNGLTNASTFGLSRTGYTFDGWGTTSSGGTIFDQGDTALTPLKINADLASKNCNSTLYAIWTAGGPYTITLDKQSGTGGTNSVSVKYDATMPSATMPTRTGYTFAGYYDATSGGTQYYKADGTSARTWNKTTATTLYARWTANKYKVTLDKQSGSGGSDEVSATYNAAMPSASMPKRDGFGFAGYYDAISDGTQYYTAAGASARVWNKAADTKLFARWEPNTYTVTLDRQNGSGGLSSVKAIYNNAMPAMGSIPSRTGYSFDGYYDATSNGTQYYTDIGASARVWNKTANATLYARWSPDTFSVTFDKQNGTGGTNSVTAKYDAAMPSATMPTRTGYDFAGYYDATSGGTQYYKADSTSARTWNKTVPTTLYAHWTPIKSIITFDKQNGTGGTNSITGTYDAAMPSATMPTRTGYDFAGYYDATSGGTQYYKADSTSARAWNKTVPTTLYANWAPIKSVITFDKQNGTGGTNSVTGTYDAAMPSATMPTRTGYGFAGYYDATSGGTQYYKADGASARTWNKTVPTTLYAVWSANTYTVTFDPDGGVVDSISKKVTYDGNYGVLPTATKTGFGFDGWYTAMNGGGTRIESDTKVQITVAQTLYAKWIADTYTLTLNPNGGSVTPSSKAQAYGSTYTLPTPIWTGYTFNGWTLSSGKGIVAKNGSSYVYTFGDGAGTVTANWIPNENTPYKVAIYLQNADGAFPASASNTTTNNDGKSNANKSIIAPEQPNYVYDGNVSGSTGLTMTIAADGSTIFKLYYKRHTFNLTVNKDGGVGGTNSQGLRWGQQIALNNPTKPSHAFSGWTIIGTGASISGTTLTMGKADVTIKANWVKTYSQFAFRNAEADFCAPGKTEQLISDSDFLKLMSYVDAKSTDPQDIKSLQDTRLRLREQDAFGGACFGMSLVSILDYNQQIAFAQNYDSGASYLAEVAKPRENLAVASALNYYQIAQSISFLQSMNLVESPVNEGASAEEWSNWKGELKRLVDDSKASPTKLPVLLSYMDYYENHTIVIKSLSKQNADGSYDLIAYDNRYPQKDAIVHVEGDFSSITISTGDDGKRISKPYGVQIIDDFSIFRTIDIDGNNNDGVITFTANKENLPYSRINFMKKGVVKIFDSAGNWVQFDSESGQFTGNMSIWGKCLNTSDTLDGSGVGTIVLEVPNSENFTISGTKGINASVSANGYYASIESEGPGVTAVLDKSNGIIVNGPGSFPFIATIGINETNMDLVQITGTANGDVGLAIMEGRGAVITGSSNQDLSVIAISSIVHEEECSFNSSYDSLLISRNEGALGVYGGDEYAYNILKPTDKEALKVRISQLKNTAQLNYTQASYDAFQTALYYAQIVADNISATQQQVDNALAALNNAFVGLTQNPPSVNKTNLLNRINEVKNTSNSNYTTASWNAFQSALTQAQVVANDASATQEQIDSALTALNNAFAGLTQNQPLPTPKKYIFSTKYEATFLNWILFFVCFGWVWMWF